MGGRAHEKPHWALNPTGGVRASFVGDTWPPRHPPFSWSSAYGCALTVLCSITSTPPLRQGMSIEKIKRSLRVVEYKKNGD